MTQNMETITVPDIPKDYGVTKRRTWPALVIGIVLAAGLVLFTLLQSLMWVTFDESQYSRSYRENRVESNTGMDEQSLMNVTREMLRYLQDGRDGLQVQAQVNGVERDIYTEREILHMADVKVLFLLADDVREIAMWVSLALLAAAVIAAHAGYLRVVGKGMLWALGAFGALVVVVALMGVIDFTWFFTQFHHLFFTNDLWLLDPANSILINMLPQPFFTGVLMEIAWRFALSLAVIAYLGYLAFMAPRRSKTV